MSQLGTFVTRGQPPHPRTPCSLQTWTPSIPSNPQGGLLPHLMADKTGDWSGSCWRNGVGAQAASPRVTLCSTVHSGAHHRRVLRGVGGSTAN